LGTPPAFRPQLKKKNMVGGGRKKRGYNNTNVLGKGKRKTKCKKGGGGDLGGEKDLIKERSEGSHRLRVGRPTNARTKGVQCPETTGREKGGAWRKRFLQYRNGGSKTKQRNDFAQTDEKIPREKGLRKRKEKATKENGTESRRCWHASKRGGPLGFRAKTVAKNCKKQNDLEGGRGTILVGGKSVK